MDKITINISDVAEKDKPAKTPDKLSADETIKLETTAAQEEINAKIKNIEQTFAIRKWLAISVIGSAILWFFVIIFFLVLQDFTSHKLDDAIMVTLLSTTTANVFALTYIVLKGFFKNQPPL
jgi:hypothetical protein